MDSDGAGVLTTSDEQDWARLQLEGTGTGPGPHTGGSNDRVVGWRMRWSLLVGTDKDPPVTVGSTTKWDPRCEPEFDKSESHFNQTFHCPGVLHSRPRRAGWRTLRARVTAAI